MFNPNFYQLIRQIFKFVIVGVVNTAIDFGVLNLLTYLSGVYKGEWLILFNIVSFSIAVTNSYLWNKYWTFKAGGRAGAGAEFLQFFLVSITGACINTIIVYTISTFISPLFGLNQELWLNLAKVVATGCSMVWNFIGYKFIVFKK